MSKAYELKILRQAYDNTKIFNDIKRARKFMVEAKRLDTEFSVNVARPIVSAIESAQACIHHNRDFVRTSGGFSIYLASKDRRYSSIKLSAVVSFEEIHDKLVSYNRSIKESIRQIREENKRPYTQTTRRYLRDGTSISVYRSGNMIMPGEIRRISLARRSKIVFTAKSPRTNERHIGIELEFISSSERTQLGNMLLESGLGEYVHLKADGSIRIDKDGYHAHELSACIPESERKVIISKIAETLSKANSLINKSCGFHVHLDMRNRDRSKAFSNLVSAQSVFYAMNPKSRKENNYCKKTMSKDLDKERKGSRYKGVNAAALSKYGTLEIRIHSGTVDGVKINNWVDLLISVADADAPFKRAPRTIDSFCKGYNISSELRSYIIERIRKFNAGADLSEVSEVG